MVLAMIYCLNVIRDTFSANHANRLTAYHSAEWIDLHLAGCPGRVPALLGNDEWTPTAIDICAKKYSQKFPE